MSQSNSIFKVVQKIYIFLPNNIGNLTATYFGFAQEKKIHHQAVKTFARQRNYVVGVWEAFSVHLLLVGSTSTITFRVMPDPLANDRQ